MPMEIPNSFLNGSCSSDVMKHGHPFDLMPGTNILRRCSFCCGRHFDGCGEISKEEIKTDDVLHFLSYSRNCSLLSTSSRMSQNFVPTFVYQRKRDHKNSVSFFEIESSAAAKASYACHSAICSEAPLLAVKEYVVSAIEHEKLGVRSPVVHPVENNKVTASSNLFCAGEEAGFEDGLTTRVDRILNDCSANDHCSSSKSNLELSSPVLKVHTNDAGEYSSFGALIAGKASEDISERDICISILRDQGLLDKVGVRRDGASNENTNNYCSKSCKVCEQVDSSKNMLICDNCDDAFHTACLNPRIKLLPVSEWICSVCLEKKQKILKDKSTSSNLANISTETDRNRHSESELELGSLEFMLRDTEPYMSNVRVGNEFQADVPDWCGLIDEECNFFGDLLEVDTSSKNCMQCREVIYGVGEGIDGTVCAKWRRAPLFEVQTDDWECFCCIFWDPTHADCAVPQELETDEVMKQLKYVEMLRPRLAARRRKLGSLKGSGSQDRLRL